MLAVRLRHRGLFLPLLCAASVFKALCGVLAGGANAAISLHWSTRGAGMAEISAKGGAVGTLSGLVGLALSLLIARFGLASAGGEAGAWCWFGTLTALHLVACERGLKLLALTTPMNARRLARCWSAFARSGSLPPPSALAAWDKVARLPDSSQAPGRGRLVGARVEVRPPETRARRHGRTSASQAAGVLLGHGLEAVARECGGASRVLEVAAALEAAGERHLVLRREEGRTPRSHVLLRRGATAADARRAVLHALQLNALPRDAPADAEAVLRASPDAGAVRRFEAALEAAGYDTSVACDTLARATVVTFDSDH